MKALLTLALVIGFATSAVATGNAPVAKKPMATPTTTKTDCSALTDAAAKAQCEAAAHAAAPVVPAKKAK